MRELATGRTRWKEVAFGEVVRLSTMSTKAPSADGLSRYIGLEHLAPGDLRIRRWGDISDGTSFTKIFRPGQVLFCKRRAYQRKVAIATFSGVCSGDIYVFEPKNARLLPEFLPFVCQTDRFFEHAVGTSAGSLSPRTKWEDLENYRFALPPVAEQKRLSLVLDASSGLIGPTRDLHSAAEAVREAALNSVGNRYATSRCPARANALVGDLLELDRTPVDVKSTRQYREIGLRSFGRGVFHKEAVTGRTLGNKRVFVVDPGRLIFNVVFAWEGAVAMTADSDVGFIASHRFPMYKSKRKDVSLEYLRCFFLSPEGLHLLGHASPGGAGRNRTLGQARFLSLPILLPPIETQCLIAARVNSIDRQVVAAAERAAAASSLHQAPLAAAFARRPA